MDLDLEAALPGRHQDALGLGQRERALFTEHIAEQIGGPVFRLPGGDRRQHLGDDQIDVPVRVSGECRRDGMRAEKGGDDPGRVFGIEQGNGIQHLQLGGGVQPVACFDFGGGGAVLEGEVKPRQTGVNQCLQAGGAGGLHRPVDSAPFGHDRLVGRPGDAPLEFLSPVTGPHKVGVRIDQSGCHQATGGVEHLVSVVLFRDCGGVSGGQHHAVTDCQRPAFDDPQVTESAAALRAACVRGNPAQLPGMDDEQVCLHFIRHLAHSPGSQPLGCRAVLMPSIVARRPPEA